MASLWEETARRTQFPRLEGDVKTDVLIIGGGMAGILCAALLEKAGVEYLLAEAGQVGGGVTGNTTAKITAQHGLVYDKLLREFGREKAKQYLSANLAAAGQLRALCQKIDCGYEERDSYVYSVSDRNKLEREVAALDALGVPAELSDASALPFPVAGAVKFSKQAQFHPLQFLFAVAAPLRIYEHTAVRELRGTTALTDCGRIRAQKIIVATHFPFLNKHGSYFLKMYQRRSYVIALSGAPDVGGMYVDEAQDGLSFRSYENFLLIGGGGHRTGKQGGSYQALRDFAARRYPAATERCHWATQDCMTLDGAPYIGAYSAGTKNLYVATGFNKWGMNSSMAAAALLCDLVQGRKSLDSAVFSPSRSILRSQLACNAFEAVTSLLTPASARCPHLGCALKWNAVEHSWDCPCHGSRFTKEGKLLDNPATGDLKRCEGEGYGDKRL